ncbi:MAG: ankyrin repeat domain-containing protein [Rickettsiales bacterium]|jgi:ankyrin repeat protein|nr:ankyrin repeat domain-containing protein [Rickettsiales bacterium]
MKTEEPKKKWRDIVKSKVMPAIKPQKGDLVDCVRVRISSSTAYLQEVATGKRTHFGDEYKMLKMDKKTLEDHQLLYESGSLVYRKDQNKKASTEGLVSKGEKNLQAFVMGKDGGLYIATHTGRFSPDPSKATLTHASFLSGVPAELAGMISINKQGKIIKITNNSGHYAPDELDMYRGIKKLGMDVFDPNCKVVIMGSKSLKISSFIQIMERVQPSGKMLHQELREDRKNEIRKEIMSISSLEHQIDHLLTHKTDQKTLSNLFEGCFENKNIALAERFITKLKDMKKLNSFLGSKMDRGYYPMHYIALKGNMGMFKMALESGVDVKVKDREGRNLLEYAGKPEMITYLCAKGVDVNSIDVLGDTVLEGNIEEYKRCLTVPNYPKNIEDIKQNIFALVNNGANIDKLRDEPIIKETKQVQEVLNFIKSKASNSKHNYKIEDRLNNLSEGCLARCLSTKDNNGETLLHVAARQGNIELCEALLDKGADVSIKNNDGKRPQDVAKERPQRTFREWISNLVGISDIKYPSKKDLNKVYQRLVSFKPKQSKPIKPNVIYTEYPVYSQHQSMVKKMKNPQSKK